MSHDPSQDSTPNTYTPPQPDPVTSGPEFERPPVMTKAAASAICGMLSLPTCMCFGVPSIILGAVAIYLGIWVRKNYRGNTASEVANLWSWVGTVAGAIGIVLGVVGAILWLLGIGSSLLGAMSDTRY